MRDFAKAFSAELTNRYGVDFVSLNVQHNCRMSQDYPTPVETHSVTVATLDDEVGSGWCRDLDDARDTVLERLRHSMGR